MRFVILLMLAFVMALSKAKAEDAAVKHPHVKADAAAIEAQIKKLGDADFAVREAAEKELFAIGKPAESALKTAVGSDDPEITSRARRLLEKIFPPLVLTAEPIGEARVGETIKF